MRQRAIRVSAGVLALLAVLFVLAAASGANAHGLSVRGLNPFDTDGESDVNWGPPGHNTPWLGDWACDTWKDNHAVGKGNTCGREVFAKVRAHEVPGCKKGSAVSAPTAHRATRQRRSREEGFRSSLLSHLD